MIDSALKEELTILVADRNPNVRTFLKRELTAAGYRIRLAENGREVVKWVYHQAPLDLLILDPDLPDLEASAVLKKLKNRIPLLPIIVHTFLSDYENYANITIRSAFVEKKGNSVEHLKQAVSEILGGVRQQPKNGHTADRQE